MAQVISTRQQIRAAVRRTPSMTPTGALETVFSRLFVGLVYPQIWEDPVADMMALEVGPSDHLVCIASGGCNVLSYLTAAPASITAVDLSPAHVALTRLKLAAAPALPDYESFHAFFGLADQPDNPHRYDTFIAPVLDAESRAYWEAAPFGRRRIGVFARGFYRFGVLGRLIGAAHLLSRLGGVDLSAVLEARTLDDQRHFFEEAMDPLLNAAIVRFLVGRRLALFGLGIPPAQYDKLAADGDGSVVPVLRERLRRLICDFPVSDNYFAWQAFGRRYDNGDSPALPPYLQQAHFGAIRANASRACVLNRSLVDVLADEVARSKHCYALLDAQDWMTDAQLNTLWREIGRTAAEDARVVFRTGGREDILPGRVSRELLQDWQYDAQASRDGFAADRSAIYGGFHVYRRCA
jgi:S-adenosylmethionine-diacylglycerol 3-amino-3-carboxypropyl transferase